MKRTIVRISVLVLIAFVFVSIALGVKAHPGRTDGNGGHTDHSTGEYHYHHGYPAHDHYDMDGDGKKDCPYDFDDKTDHSSGGGNSGSYVNRDTSTTPIIDFDIPQMPTVDFDFTFPKKAETTRVTRDTNKSESTSGSDDTSGLLTSAALFAGGWVVLALFNKKGD